MKPIKDKADGSEFKTVFWGLLGIFATVVLGMPAIYYAVHEKQPHISYELIGDSKVLDVHQPVKELEIRYRGEDIYAQHKNLRVWTITVRNDGETHVKQEDFDKTMPWGIMIKDAQIVDVPKLISCNSDYVSNNISLALVSNNVVTFQKIIFEREKYFTVEIQLLHRADNEPSAEILGKIAGIERQTLTANHKDNGSVGFWASVFSGSVSVQLLRLIIYVAGTIIFAILIISTLAWATTTHSSSKRKKLKHLMASYLEPILTGRTDLERDRLESLFIKSEANIDDLRKTKDFLAHPDNLQTFLVSLNDLDIPLPKEAAAFPKTIRRNMAGVVFGEEKNLFADYSRHESKYFLRPGIFDELEELIRHLEATALPPKLMAFLAQQNNPRLDNLRYFGAMDSIADVENLVIGDSSGARPPTPTDDRSAKSGEASKDVQG